MIKVWDDDLLRHQSAGSRHAGAGKSRLADLVAGLRRRSRASVVPSQPAAPQSVGGGLSERLAERRNHGPRYARARGWQAWSPDAIDALRARARAGGGGRNDIPRLPEADGCPYELRVLHRPGNPDAGAESRWYRTDLATLRAFNVGRALLTDPDLGLGLAILRDGCLVYEWTEHPGGIRNLDLGAHRRRGCTGHVSQDAFDGLTRVYDHYCAVGYREGGECSRLCADSCPGDHGDLLAAMLRAEAAVLGRDQDSQSLDSEDSGVRP